MDLKVKNAKHKKGATAMSSTQKALPKGRAFLR